MKLRSTGVFMGKWCAHCIASFVLWTVWLVLSAILVLQAIVAFSHELRVPNRIVRSFENGMAHAGLRVRFDTASFDPSGHVLIENFRLFSESFDEPLLTASSVYLQVDPWALLAGSFEARWVNARGVALYLPAMLSPSGRAEAVLGDLTVMVEHRDSEIRIRQLTGRSGPLAVVARGSLLLPRTKGRGNTDARAAVASALSDYLRVSKELVLAQARLSGFESPSLRLVFRPDLKHLARVDARFSARSADLDRDSLALPTFDRKVTVEALAVETALPLVPDADTEIHLRASARRVASSDGLAVADLSARLSGRLQAHPFSFVPGELVASAGAVEARGYEVESVSLRLQPQARPRLRGELSATFAGQPWRVHADLDPKTGSGSVQLSGELTEAMISLAGRKLGRDLGQFLRPEAPVRLAAGAELAPGWKLLRADGHFESGRVVAHNVELDRAEAHFAYDGATVNVTDILLLQGQNLAHGSYWMDTKSLDYRFLLTGRLRPAGIAGWFHDWWTHFWDYFDFTAAPPVADVDVQGRWREPHLSTVFVHVDCDAPVIRGVPLDLVRTSLFIRPHFYDALELFATRAGGSARGRFTRVVDLDRHGFRWMEFQVESSLDLQESARLFGKEGTELVEPFRFEKPPHLKLSGRLEGEASDHGTHEDVSIEAASTGGFWFFDFPLSNLTCKAEVHDDQILVPEVKVNFATGTARGHAHVKGRGNERSLSFEAAIDDAGLGESIHILEDFSARLRGEKPPPVSRFQQRVATGRLSLRASAAGLYHDSHSYVGQGTADLTGAELAQINLLGALSEALRGNSLLGFTSWRLDTAHARFAIARDELVFPELTITGPTAKLDAKGSYGLESKKMNFNAKFYPFDQGKTLLANAVDLVLTPVSAVLELKLTGSLDKPKWFFAYGPTSLLRKLSGTGPSVKPEESLPAPSPLLLRP